MFGIRATAIAIAALAVLASAPQADAFEQSTARKYSQMLDGGPSRAAPVPASYRLVTDESKPRPSIEGATRYFGGKSRIVFIDGRAVKLPENELVAYVRSGYIVPVYEATGNPLDKEDWIVSLPTWLGYATVEAAR